MAETEFDPAAIGMLVEDIGEGAAREVLGVFFKDTTEKLGVLAAVDSTDQIEFVTRHAHSIKSAAATFGFTGIWSRARQLEAEAAWLPLTDIKARIDALSAAVTTARSFTPLR